MTDENFLFLMLAFQQEKIKQIEGQIQNLQNNHKEINLNIATLQQATNKFHTMSQINFVLDIIPVPCFVLDRKGIVCYCNRIQAEEMLVSNPKKFIHRPISEIAQEYHWERAMLESVLHNNALVLAKNQLLEARESMIVYDKLKVYLSKKRPTNLYGNAKVVLGVSFDITQQIIFEQQLQQEQVNYDFAKNLDDPRILNNVIEKLSRTNLSIKNNGKEIVITEKQAVCLLHMIRLGTAKKVAKVMGISHRTVEEHLNILREKFQCHTKLELLFKMMTGQFFNNLTSLLT